MKSNTRCKDCGYEWFLFVIAIYPPLIPFCINVILKTWSILVTVILEILAAMITIVAVWLISIPKIEGLYLILFAQFLWATFSIINYHLWLFIQSLILLLININAIKNWKKKQIG